MRRGHPLLGLAVLPLLAALPLTPLVRDAERRAEEAAVRAALQHYLDGHATGKAEVMARAFHPEAHLTWIADGELRTRSLEDYLGGMTGTPPADEAERRRWIESVDIAGTAATGKIVLDYPNARFVDYMSMLRVDGEWKIVHKSFHVERKGG